MIKQALMLSTASVLLMAGAVGTATAQTKMLSAPSIAGDKIAFVYAGDIYVSNHDGSGVRRLTSDPAREGMPYLSDDGQWVAYSANYSGNWDVYVISVNGGQPKQLTWHPGNDLVTGWSNEGMITFNTTRTVMERRGTQQYHVSPNGGMPTMMMKALVDRGDFNDDGSLFAYNSFSPAHSGASGWRNYRGGRTPHIWVMNTSNYEVEKIPHDRVNDTYPMFVGDKVFFISDRNRMKNIWAFDTNSKQLEMVTDQQDWDIRSAAAHGNMIVYEAGGELYTLDTNNGRTTKVAISINPDLQQLRPQWKNAARMISSMDLSPSGKRVVVSARGDVFTVPLKDGGTKNLTATDGAREKDAIWSPDGAHIAYISDASGEHRLVLDDQHVGGESKSFTLGDPNYYRLLGWTGDSKHIMFENQLLTLFVINVESGDISQIDQNNHRAFGRGLFDPASSPDGRYIAYNKMQANYFNDLMIYDLETGQKVMVSDGMSEVGSPVFSKDGHYLYFTASTNYGQSQIGLDMSTQEKPVRRALYAVVLSADGKSPLLPKTGDEMVGDKKEAGADTTSVDFDGIQSRIVALPVDEHDYTSLAVGKDGALYYLKRQQPGSTRAVPGSGSPFSVHEIHRFDMDEKKATSIASDVAGFGLSYDGSTLLISYGGGRMASAVAGAKVTPKPVNTSDVKMLVDPRKEWAQIFDETWRMERDYFYDPNMHGLDWSAVRRKYEALLPHVATRSDLNDLLVEMIAVMEVGHNRIGGGDVYSPDRVTVGLLGADIGDDGNGLKIDRIFTGENWNPFVEAPLAAPGLGVNEGDYIVAVNGQAVNSGDNIYSFFMNTSGKQTVISVNDRARLAGARDVTIVPTGNDRQLRLWNWIESNRKHVHEATNGRAGYAYLPNTAGGGYTYFNRMYYAQVDRDAFIVDERSNGGGQAANYVTDILNRMYEAGWKDRAGLVFDTPAGAIHGPKVMLIDQNAGSGGDYLPYTFRQKGIGMLIGVRTWGGLIGIGGNPGLIDNGGLSVPYFRYFNPEGEWEVENIGVPADMRGEMTPKEVNSGIDPILEAGIAEIMRQLETFESPRLKVAPKLPTELGK